jgi:hypothetical protein
MSNNNFGGVPVGAIIMWNKSFSNTPTQLPFGWAECNGQTITDSNSIYNGQAVPNINPTQRFVRGASTSSGTGGSDTHSHDITFSTQSFTISGPGTQTLVTSVTSPTATESTLPSYYQAVFIIKIK